MKYDDQIHNKTLDEFINAEVAAQTFLTDSEAGATITEIQSDLKAKNIFLSKDGIKILLKQINRRMTSNKHFIINKQNETRGGDLVWRVNA